MDIASILSEKVLALGAFKCGSLPVSEVPFDPSLRKSCEQNYCGNFGRNYMCPPDCGEIHELIEQAKTYDTLFLFQTVSELEDSYDFEGMMEAGVRHKALVQQFGDQVKGLAEAYLILGAGGCNLCERCAKQTNEPCRHPEDAHPSLEAYGMYVAKLAEKCGMKYINGQNTVTYFGAVLYR